MTSKLSILLADEAPVLAMAPMQDITDASFWALVEKRGGADVYFTEYFRVYAGSILSRRILSHVTSAPAGKPVVAQMIGNDLGELVRSARQLQEYPIAGIDLNLGCPAPIVYKKCAGGGLLRNLEHVDRLLGELRAVIRVSFSVKTRIGFDSPDEFDDLLRVLAKHSLDLVTIHGRTVRQLYGGAVRYDLIARAAETLACPVLANGSISSAQMAVNLLRKTCCKGLMLGRGAVRNPWLFAQIRAVLEGQELGLPTGREVLDYICELREAVCDTTAPEKSQVQRLKKFMNFLGAGVEGEGQFLFRIQRARTLSEFFEICNECLADRGPMKLEPVVPAGLRDADVHPQFSAVHT